MKIGILTFQYSINFGAQLQCYALQKVVESKGFDVKIINYIPEEKKPIKFYKGLGLRENGVLYALQVLFFRFLHVKKAAQKIRDFQQENLNLTIPCNYESIDDIAKDFDAIIVGSDQVWGPAYHGTKVYFLDNLPSFKGKKISYAPCCAYNKVNEKDKSRLSQLLQKFDSISVRNTETQTFVRDLINQEAPIVQDPTFLYDFGKEKSSLDIPYKKYILTYLIGKEIEGGHEKAIEEIKLVHGDIPVVAIVLSTYETLHYFSWADKIYWKLNPFEWLSLISSCTFFYTDSFHGIVFALKNQKPFIGFYSEEKRKSRFVDLMKRFDLSNVIVKSVSEIKNKNSVLNNVNYPVINKLLEEELNKSNEFLNGSLK